MSCKLGGAAHSALIGRAIMLNRGCLCVLSMPTRASGMSSGAMGPRCRRKSRVSSRVSFPIKSDCTGVAIYVVHNAWWLLGAGLRIAAAAPARAGSRESGQLDWRWR
eukprot:441481-Pyramimonas_sp.AAC.1